MTVLNGIKKALTMLLPVGVLGISSALALASLRTGPVPAERRGKRQASSVADRLRDIRKGISEIDKKQEYVNEDGVLLAEWPNFRVGWGNGGWRNGGWHNGGWGWRNGGWHNWGNGGWPNGGWRNYWHNW